MAVERPRQIPLSQVEPIDNLSLYRQELDQLPRMRLSLEQEQALKQRLLEGDETARNTVVEANVRLVMKIAMGNLRQVERLELIQAGNLGLVEAAQRYEHVETGNFRYYAAAAIRNKIGEFLSEKNLINVPPELRKQIDPFLQVEATLLQRHFRNPTIEEIAKEMGTSVQEALEVARVLHSEILSLNIGKYDHDSDEDEYLEYVPDEGSDFAERLTISETQGQLTPAERALQQRLEKVLTIFTPRQRQLLRMQYGLCDGISRNFEDIAVELNLTTQSVGQTVKKIRTLFEEETPERTIFHALVYPDKEQNTREVVAKALNNEILGNVITSSYSDRAFETLLSSIKPKLTPRQQEILKMYHEESLLFREIANRLKLGDWIVRNEYKGICLLAKEIVVEYLIGVNPIEEEERT